MLSHEEGKGATNSKISRERRRPIGEKGRQPVGLQCPRKRPQPTRGRQAGRLEQPSEGGCGFCSAAFILSNSVGILHPAPHLALLSSLYLSHTGFLPALPCVLVAEISFTFGLGLRPDNGDWLAIE
jgi:hypothetical protein